SFSATSPHLLCPPSLHDALPIFSLLGVFVYPAIVQKFVVAPNELSKETPQLRRHIDATRRAWGLDRVLVRDLSGEARLTERDIQDRKSTRLNSSHEWISYAVFCF